MNAVSLDFDRRPSAVQYMVRGVLPVKRQGSLAPQLIARWRGHGVDRDELASFVRIAGLSEGGRCKDHEQQHNCGNNNEILFHFFLL